MKLYLSLHVDSKVGAFYITLYASYAKWMSLPSEKQKLCHGHDPEFIKIQTIHSHIRHEKLKQVNIKQTYMWQHGIWARTTPHVVMKTLKYTHNKI